MGKTLLKEKRLFFYLFAILTNSHKTFYTTSRGRRDLSEKGYRSSGAQLIPKDSVLFTSRAPVGYCVLAANEISTNQGFKSLVLKGGINPKYIRHYLLSSKQYAESLASGSTFKELSGHRIASLEIPIPPLNEQKYIVFRIEELQTRSRRARAALEAIPDLLDQLRQSILAAAFRGDLTKEWREKHSNIEPAAELLKRICTERRKRWEKAELEKLKAKGLTEEKLKEAFAVRRKQYKEPGMVDTTDLPELPEGWIWVSGEYIVPADAPIVYGIIQPGPHIHDGVPYIRPLEIQNDVIVDAQIPRTSPKIATKYDRAKLSVGDIILSIVGTIGKVAIVPKHLDGANITQSSARLRPWTEFITSEYLAEVLRSVLLRSQYEKFRFGNAVQRLNIAHVRALAIPLPPLDEQQELVKTIQQRAVSLSAVKSVVTTNLKRLEDLLSVVLTKAFHGDLVPQDPNDEPASTLLDRIRQEKASAKIEPKAKVQRKGKKMKSRQGEQKNILAVLRKSGHALTPEEVFAASGFDEASVDIFYEQLRAEIDSKNIREIRKGKAIRLEAVVS